MEDLRARTTLFCGVLAFAIALSMLLRGRRAVHLLFAAFATTVAFWYTSQSLAGFLRSEIWFRATVAFTVLLPQFAVHLFDSIVPVEQGMVQKSAKMRRSALFVGIPMLALGVSPYREHPIARVLIYSYVFGFLLAALVSLARQGQKSSSRAVRDRVRFLVATGALACTFTLADFIVFFGVSFPPIGAVLAIVFLFVLSESLARPRMADIYELSGRLMVSTLLAFALAGIFYCFITYVGQLGTMYLNAVLASIVFLVLFEPLQDQVRSRVHQFFFRERYDLETSVTDLRKRLAHALEAEEMVDTVLSGLERSRRVTSAAIYLIDSDGDGFDLAGSLGAPPNKRLESIAIRPILDRLKTTLSLEEIAMRAAAQTTEASKEAPFLAAATMLGPFERGALFAVRSDGDDLQGLLAIVDDRVREAFTPEELALIENVASQMGIAIANSRIYARMKERDRLAALGSMAAGLAHEVKNPLGAIKGAAQLLEEAPGDASTKEFLSIILEETDRLNRVVGSFLDYARPRSGNPAPIDINAAVKRTVQILSSQQSTDVDLQVELSPSLPLAKIDAEQFRQVLINLVQNAIQAMDGHGRVTVTTARRRAARGEYTGPTSDRGERGDRSDRTMAERANNAKMEAAAEVIEVSVRDTGPGIAPKVLKNLFIPFFTTKDSGTGLGLAISQRLIQNAGGTIEVQSQAGAGTKFTIVLPGVAELSTPLPSPAEPTAAE